MSATNTLTVAGTVTAGVVAVTIAATYGKAYPVFPHRRRRFADRWAQVEEFLEDRGTAL